MHEITFLQGFNKTFSSRSHLRTSANQKPRKIDMKKLSLSLICALALLISGCSKKEIAEPKDEKLYPVTFNVSTFSKEIVPMASLKTAGQISASTTSGKALSDAVKYITYAVYNESGIEVNRKTSYASEANFGKIEDSLPKGKYKIVILGTLRVAGNVDQYYDNGWVYISSGWGGDDTFFGQVDIDVQGSVIEQSLELVRKAGKIEIELLDEIPVDIEEIIYTIQGISNYFNMLDYRGNNNSEIYNSNYYVDYPENGEVADYTQDLNLYFFLSYDLPTTAAVNIRAYDRNRNLVVDKTITDVPVAINKKTILTGRLFDEVGSTKGQAFSVSIDDKWNSDINHVNF